MKKQSEDVRLQPSLGDFTMSTMITLGYFLQLLLLTHAIPDDSSIRKTVSASVTVSQFPVNASTPSSATTDPFFKIGAHFHYDPTIRLYPLRPHFMKAFFTMDSICNDAVPWAAPSIGNPTVIEGRQAGHYVFPPCSNFVIDGGPAAAYKLIGTGDVFEATTFQVRYLTVYRGCVEGRSAPGHPYPAAAGLASADLATHSSDAERAAPVDSSNTGSESSDSSADEPNIRVAAGNLRMPPRPNNAYCVGDQSDDRAIWKTEPGEEYTVIVHGGNSGNSAPLSFVLSVAAFEASYAENRSSPAVELGPITLNKSIATAGTTYGGVFLTDLPTCETWSSPVTDTSALSPTALYIVEVVNANVLVKASLKGDGQVSIYQGGCNDGGWTCVPTFHHSRSGPSYPRPLTMMGNPEYPPPYMGDRNVKQLSWHNEGQGTKYMIAVRTCCGSQAVGDHLLSVSASTYGNFCDDVTEANMLNFTDRSSFDDKKIFPGLISCNDKSPQRTPTALYKFTGTGDTLFATISNPYDFSPPLALYTISSCRDSAPVCLASHRNILTLFSPTVKGETYYLAVYSSSYSDLSDKFVIDIKSFGYQDLCSAVMDLGIVSETPSVGLFSNSASFITDLNSCTDLPENFQSPSVAYSFIAGDTGTLSVETSNAWFIQRVLLLEGTCDNFECSPDEHQVSCGACGDLILTRTVEAGKKYLIVVFGCGPRPVQLSLGISKAFGDPCVDAVVIDNLADGLEVTGSLKDGSQYPFNNRACSSDTKAPAVIYAFQADKDQWIDVTVRSNGWTLFADVFRSSVPHGECRGQLLGSARVIWRMRTGSWSWKAHAGATYYLVVSSESLQTVGDFKLLFHVKEKGDICKDVVDLGPVNESGLIYAVPIDGNLNKFYELQYCYDDDEVRVDEVVDHEDEGDDDVEVEDSHDDLGPFSAVYSFTAGITGKMAVKVKTNADGQIAVYSGICQELACVGGTEFYDLLSFDVQEGNAYDIAINQDEPYGRGKFMFIVLEPVREGDVIAVGKSTGDLCSDVEDLGGIPENGFLVTGTTMDMPHYSGLHTCDAYSSALSGTKLYAITTSSQGIVSVAVTGIDIYASVYQGNCNGELVCVPGHNWIAASSFNAEPNAVYYVAVYGSGRSSGNFFLHVGFAPTASLCHDSIPIASIPDKGLSPVGSTENGRIYKSLPNCNGAVQSNSPALAYAVVGNGGRITASLSDVVLSDGSWDYCRPSLVVYSNDCSSPQCFDFISDYSRVTWSSVLNASYFLLVSLRCDESQSTMQFELELKPTKSADLCTNAIDLGAPGVDGVIMEANAHNGEYYFPALSVCTVESGLSWPATVYSIKTETRDVYHTEVSPGWGIAIVSGSCDSVTSIGGDGLGSSAGWATVPNVTYYIAVVGDRTRNPTLTLKSISTGSACDDEGVTNLGKIPSEGLVLRSSTISGPIFRGIPPCVNEYPRGLWTPSAAFRFDGNRDAYLVFLENVSGFNAQVTAYKGDCERLECAKFKTVGPNMVLVTEINTTYTVVVNDYSTNRSGTFELRFVAAVAGDVEQDAVDINIPESGLFMSGSTIGGKFYDLPSGYNMISGPGVAYRVHSGIGSWTASAKGFSIDAQISVHAIDENGGLVCHGVQREGKHVSWTSNNPNEVVYIVVSGSDLSVGGDYALRVHKSLNPIGQKLCDGVIDLGSVGEKGVLRIESKRGGLSAINMSSCSDGHEYSNAARYIYPGEGFVGEDVPAALYTVRGQGAQITATVLVPSTLCPWLSIKAYAGSCGAFECIPSVDAQSSQVVSWNGEACQSYFIMVLMPKICGTMTFALLVHESSVPAAMSEQLASQYLRK